MSINREIRERIIALQIEHRDLNEILDRVSDTALHDQLYMQRLKKRKLHLKDQICSLKSQLMPDIIA
ncbi:MAG: hypothetical protein CBB68_09995 [Rhodospirillaceae bacterium TMED8]|nr:hypothetical protein [Magnetovibrio sp.]OUT50186.1 MAG: hypothetical protein CBB68_09995 [Rhodospirillaceae bacterium TMED8]|tara:strand:- start:148 stop:348 length:201 start_codon:yes stop_codon:yes gene_type:complete